MRRGSAVPAVGALILLSAAGVRAQMRPGDVAVVAYNSDGVDDFAWVALRTIPAGTVLRFTDSSVSNGYFRWTEHLGEMAPGPLAWTHTDPVGPGTVVRWITSGATNWSLGTFSGARPKLNTDGDQIFVYTGTIVSNAALQYPWRGNPAAATMIFGINFANAGWNNVTGGDTTSSYIPPGLATGNFTAVYVDGKDNGFYSGIRTGTVAELRRAIADPANWQTADEPFLQADWPAAFRIVNPGTILTAR